MPQEEVSVTFQPSGQTVYVLPGTKLLEAAAGAGLVLDSPCGGEGRCRKCRVRVVAGAAAPAEGERQAFPPADVDSGWRLACQSAVEGPATVEVPESSLLAWQQKILTWAVAARPEGDPVVRKRYVELPAPARGRDEPDLIRLEQAIGPFQVDLGLLQQISQQLRQTDFCGMAVLAGDRLLDFEPKTTAQQCFAVATDVGTTTLVSALLELSTAREVAVASGINPQTRFGDDVLSRILYTQQHADGLAQLQQAIVEAVDELIGQLCLQADIPRERIYALTFSGNTTMQQLLCGVDPQWLGRMPFVPACGHGLSLSAAELGFQVHPRAEAYVLPVIGGFVGGDTVSGLLATGLTTGTGPTLFVDIGTNGEIVLCANGKLAAASTAAGPAFEGARISQGMRGTLGAIEKVLVDEQGRFRYNVIGNVPPVGLCGSGLIDLAAELLRHKLLSPQGRLQRLHDAPAEHLRRVILVGDQLAFVLAFADETGHGKPILLTQQDVRELQLAKGAVRAGIATLLRRAGLEAKDLEAVLVGGGFGNFIRRRNAQRIGLLPHEIERHRIRYQGNTSLAGARLCALSRQARQTAEDLARQTEHVDLSTDRDFHAAFAAAMVFPT